MKEIKIREATKDDLRDMLTEIEKPIPNASGLFENGIAVSGEVGGDIVFCCGAVFCGKQAWEIWLVTGINFHKYIGTYSSIRSILEDSIRKYSPLWIQTHVLSENKKHKKFIERLGFSFGLEKPGFGPEGETYDIYYRRCG